MVTKCDKATTGVPSLGTYHKKKLVSKKAKLTVSLKGLSIFQHSLKRGGGEKIFKIWARKLEFPLIMNMNMHYTCTTMFQGTRLSFQNNEKEILSLMRSLTLHSSMRY